MIKLIDINEDNWLNIANINVTQDQRQFVASPLGILARAYVYRSTRARAMFIEKDGLPVGLLMVKDLDDEPACYDLQQFLIDLNHQRKGYGRQALEVLLGQLKQEAKYSRVEVCVNKRDQAAIKLYQGLGFEDSGYIDPDLPGSLNLIYKFDHVE